MNDCKSLCLNNILETHFSKKIQVYLLVKNPNSIVLFFLNYSKTHIPGTIGGNI